MATMTEITTDKRVDDLREGLRQIDKRIDDVRSDMRYRFELIEKDLRELRSDTRAGFAERKGRS